MSCGNVFGRVSAMAEVKEMPTDKKARHRSPAYPAVGLREAIDRVAKLYKTDGKAGAPPKLAAVHIGFTTAHGQALGVLAALKKFGLVSEVNGRIVPSQRAIEILNLPTNDTRRVQAIKDAALGPEIYRELIEQHRDTGWPADDVLQADLITYRNFNPKAVAGFVKDFKDTLEFAGLSDLSVLVSEEVKVGDYVQWEPSGVLQFQEPKRVRSISEDGQFVFVDGSDTGLPVTEVTREKAPLGAQNPPPPGFQSLPNKRMQEDVFSLSEGKVVIQWPTPLSQDSIQDLKDWLQIVERKITRSVIQTQEPTKS